MALGSVEDTPLPVLPGWASRSDRRVSACSDVAQTTEMSVILTEQLGVSEKQAKGRAGLLFKMAKDKLGAEEFSQAASAVPGIEDLISSAPESGGISSAIGGIASSLGGGGASKLENLASLAGGFKKLNIDAGMVSKFIPIILSAVQSKGGETVKGILEKVIK